MIPAGANAAANETDVPWHFDGATHRVLVRVWAPPAGSPLARPVRIPIRPETMPTRPQGLRAWDLTAGHAAPVQSYGDQWLLDPGTPIAAGQEHRYLLYLTSESPAVAPVIRMDDSGRVETEHYIAQVDRRQGGMLSSLVLKDGGKRIETLGDGLRWWTGRKPQISQASFGSVDLKRTANGSVFTGLRITYPNLLTPGNSLVLDYRFFKDFIEIDYHYSAAHPARIEWMKIPVSVRATGQTPGLLSNSRTKDGPMLTAGAANRWIADDRWHDVSYFGPEPFAIGLIARNRAGGLYYMDSVKSNEQEWIYAEPFGWNNAVAVDRDFDVQLTIVPHAAGRGRWVDTTAKIESEAGTSISVFQKKGSPAIDSDGDGLPDLVELARGTNPNCPDTDFDGIPDGLDPDPLRGDPPKVELRMPQFKAEPTARPQSLAQVKPVLGVPTLVIDGKPYGPMTYTRCAGSLPQLAEMADHHFPVHFEMVGSIGWPGDQAAVFQRVDKQMHRFLDQVPNARVVLRLYVCNPPHFARDYPEEVLKFNDGSTQHFSRWYAMTDRPIEERGYPSFASQVWRDKTAEALREYVAHVRQTDYSKNVIGYFVCGGGTEEWYYWGDYDMGQYRLDFSQPMLRAFRTYLRVKYGGDVGKLRAAWNDPQADFGTAAPPDPRMRMTMAGSFWDPQNRHRMRDYYYVHNKVMEDALLVFSHAVKQACDGQQLVGMFHGYLQNHSLLEGGQATLLELLRSPDVDFWSGPPQYDRRGQGEHGCVRFLMASLKQHGKLWISESDLRTNFSEFSLGNPSLHGRPPGLEESLACLKREFAHQLCEGGNGWWFQMGPSWYHQPPILSLFEQMQDCGEAAVGVDRTSDTDIAAVVDLGSMLEGPHGPVTNQLIDAFKVQETCRIGAPVDHYELSDILAPDAKHYKLYLMINCFNLNDRQRQLIDGRLRRDGATLVWMYAPGLFNSDRSPERDSAHTRQLSGFPLRSEIGEPVPLDMRLTAEGARFLSGFDAARVFGGFERPQWSFDPKTNDVKQKLPGKTQLRERFFGATESGALARFVDGGKPSILVRQTATATDLWIGSVMAPADLLRSVARRAGCHLFCDADEIIYANRSFLAIHTAQPGPRTFKLRREADVIEIFSGELLGRNVTGFTETIPAYRTRVYFLGKQQQWQAQQKRAKEYFAGFIKELKAQRAERASTAK